jgi:hypothetical protein
MPTGLSDGRTGPKRPASYFASGSGKGVTCRGSAFRLSFGTVPSRKVSGRYSRGACLPLARIRAYASALQSNVPTPPEPPPCHGRMSGSDHCVPLLYATSSDSTWKAEMTGARTSFV